MFVSVYFISQEPEFLSVSRSISQIKKILPPLYIFIYRGGIFLIWLIKRLIEKKSGACVHFNHWVLIVVIDPRQAGM